MSNPWPHTLNHPQTPFTPFPYPFLHPQVCSTFIAQLRRQLHTLRPPQLAAVLHAMGSYRGRWKPGRRFLFDFVTQSRGKVESWTAQEAANVLWSFASLGWVLLGGMMWLDATSSYEPVCALALHAGCCTWCRRFWAQLMLLRAKLVVWVPIMVHA